VSERVAEIGFVILLLAAAGLLLLLKAVSWMLTDD